MVPDKSELLRLRELMRQSIEAVMQDDFFPEGCCGFAATALEHIYNLGYATGEYRDARDRRHPHAWNYDSETGLYVDITLDQFPNVSDPIVILTRDTSILLPKRIEPHALWSERLCSNGQMMFAHFIRLYHMKTHK